MADPVTLQDIYDLFKASQADLQASREEFEPHGQIGQVTANTSREVGRLGDRWGTLR